MLFYYHLDGEPGQLGAPVLKAVEEVFENGKENVFHFSFVMDHGKKQDGATCIHAMVQLIS